MAGRETYRHFTAITTRWMDNDVYGHVNNVLYYSFFDTVINLYLVREGGLDFHVGPVIGLCAESHCRYMAPLAFPETVDAGLRVEHLGRSSVRYGLGLFKTGEAEAAAEGWFVHVFIDRESRKAAAMPEKLRKALEAIRVEALG